MKTSKDLKLICLVVFFCALTSAVNGQITVLRPGATQNSNGCETLSWRTLPEPTVNFWEGYGRTEDTVAVWFQPLAPCSLLAIRFYPYDYEGTFLLNVWDGSRYDGHITTTDSTDSSGWMGDFEDGTWIPGRVMKHSPLGWNKDDPAHHYWGLFPLTVTRQLTGQWIEVPTASGLQGEVDLGSKPFLISITLYQTSGGGLAGENEGTTPYHTFNFFNYSQWGTGPDGEHFGWFIHSTSVWIEAVVKYYHTTDVEQDDDSKSPSSYLLFQNYPNPFNPSTHIRYQIADSRYPVHTTLEIFNILGQEVRTLVNELKEPGQYSVTWDGTDSSGREVGSGIYFCRLEGGDYTATKRMVLMK